MTTPILTYTRRAICALLAAAWVAPLCALPVTRSHRGVAVEPLIVAQQTGAAQSADSVANAPSVLADFEAGSPAPTISVYDAWPESPFRTGRLQGNVAIVPNPFGQTDPLLGHAPDASACVLAVQRSRYGSNLFGARIELAQPFELTPAVRYVHVLIHKPVAGRVMLIGLGKRPERAAQSPATEQFWETSLTPVIPGRWCDAVFAIKGAGGIDIHSLVVVPDCESPHELKTDFAAYVDEIELNDNPAPRFVWPDSVMTDSTAVAAQVTVRNIGGLNGDLLRADGTKFTTVTLPAGQPLTLRLQPAPKFRIGGLRVHYGKISERHEVDLDASRIGADGRLTLPAECLTGEVELEPYFVSAENQ